MEAVLCLHAEREVFKQLMLPVDSSLEKSRMPLHKFNHSCYNARITEFILKMLNYRFPSDALTCEKTLTERYV